MTGQQAERRTFDKVSASRRPTAVSQALRAIRDDLDEIDGRDVWNMVDGEGHKAFRVIVAADLRTRERAYRLAHRVYARCGFVPADEEALCVAPYDSDPHTLTLLVEDENHKDVATASLVFDSAIGLPCDEIYRDELNVLRNSGHKLVEVTRLVLDGEHSHSKLLLTRLFNFLYIFAWRVCGFTDFVIEVNPHHVGYYRRLLKFEQIGPERPCPRVQGAPAVLLRLSLRAVEKEIELQRMMSSAPDSPRNLYSSSLNASDEASAVRFLREHRTPMSREEAQYFHLA